MISKKNPVEVGFLYCDEISSFQDLRVAIEPFKGRSVLILDEISFVKEWWRTIRSLLDQNTFSKIIVTGSNTWDIKHGADLMPGRWGGGGEIEILPMDFLEFQKAYKDCGFQKASKEEMLKKYFWTGGFPISLVETKGETVTPTQTIDTIKRWLVGDAIKLGKNEKYLRDLLLQIALTQQSPLSLQKLAQRSQLGSHHTAIDYVTLLESTFCVKTLYAYDLDRKIFQNRKNKKFYFRDPIYFHLAYDWNGLNTPQDLFEKMAEAAAFEYLNRRHTNLGYIHTQKGEVDFIVPGKLAVEVKWGQVLNLSKAYKELPLANKRVWQPGVFFDME